MSCPNASDINADGTVELVDASMLMLYLFKNGLEPPAPFGECGFETGPSGLTCEGFPPCEG